MSPTTQLGALLAMDSTDQELVAAARRGEVEAFTELVLRYQARVFAIACVNTHDTGLAEDACQDTFIIAWQRLDTLKDDAAIGSWFCGIARNRIRSLGRQGNRESLGGAVPPEHADEKTPLHDLMDREAAASLWTLVGQIPARYREPMLLHYSCDQSVADIAECLSLSDAAVKKRLSRGRSMLRDQSERFVELASACRAPASLATAVALLLRQEAASASTRAVGGSIFATIVKGLLVKKTIAILVVLTLCIGGFALFRSPDETRAAASKGEQSVSLPRTSIAQAPPSRSGFVQGRVVDAATGKPLAGARISTVRNAALTMSESVSLRSEVPSIAIADEAGNFAVELATGEFALSASANGYILIRPVQVRVAAERTAEVELKLIAGGVRFHGRVTDIGGGPIVGATLTCDQGEGLPGLRHRQQVTTTTDDGSFEIWLASGKYKLKLDHLDYAPHQSDLLIAASDLEQDFSLVPASSIEGVVLRGDSMQPVPGAVIFSSTGKNQQGTVADGQGRFRLARVLAGTTLLHASASGGATPTAVTLDLGIGEARGDVELRLATGYEIRGRVVDGAGQAVQDAEVQLAQMDGSFEHPARKPTDEEGHFAIDGVAPGRYVLLAAHSDHPLAVSMDAATVVDRDLDGVLLPFSKAINIVGKVVPATPSMVYVAQAVGLFGLNGSVEGFVNTLASPTRVDPNGSFRLAPLPVGSYQLLALADDGRRGSFVIGPETSEEINVEIALSETVSFTGVIRTEAGEAVDGVLVTVTSQDYSPAQAIESRTDSMGRYTMVGLAPGNYEVSLKNSGCDRHVVHNGQIVTEPWQITVEGEGASTVDFDFTVTSCGASVTGTVVDANEAPVADTWLYAKTGGVQSPPVLSDEDGRFVIAGLSDGAKVALHAYHPSQGRAIYEKVATGSQTRVELSPGARLDLHVRGKSGPVTSYQVSLRGPSLRTEKFVSLVGDARIPGLTPGNYAISVKSNDGYGDGQTSIDVGELSQSVVLEIAEWAVVRGRIVQEDGRPAAGVWLTPLSDGFSRAGPTDAEALSLLLGRVQADSNGRFALRRVRSGSLGIVVTTDADSVGVIRLKIAEGEVRELGDVKPEPLPSADL